MDLSKLTILAEKANDKKWLKWATACYIKLEKCTAPLTAEEIRFSSSESEKNCVDYVKEHRFEVILNFYISILTNYSELSDVRVRVFFWRFYVSSRLLNRFQKSLRHQTRNQKYRIMTG